MPVKEHFVVVLDLVLVEAEDLPKFDSKNLKFLVKKKKDSKTNRNRLGTAPGFTGISGSVSSVNEAILKRRRNEFLIDF